MRGSHIRPSLKQHSLGCLLEVEELGRVGLRIGFEPPCLHILHNALYEDEAIVFTGSIWTSEEHGSVWN